MQSIDRLMQTQVEQHNAKRQAILEHRQLVREAFVGRTPNRVLAYQPVLVNVGKRMVIWGLQLQRRFAESPRLSERELQFQQE